MNGNSEWMHSLAGSDPYNTSLQAYPMQQRDSPTRSDIYLLCIGLGVGPAAGLSPGSHEDISMLVIEYTGTFAPPQNARKPNNIGTCIFCPNA